jgi:hypothetical protein
LSCDIPLWSPTLQRLIEASAGEVRLWDLAGQRTAAYPGEQPLALAPSGQRLLAGQTWINLETGATVTLPGWQYWGGHIPGWTADEHRLFTCCFKYADVNTGEAWSSDGLPGLFVTGRGSWPGEESYSHSLWLPGEARVMVQADAVLFGAPDVSGPVAPVIDPLTQTYTDLFTALHLDAPPYCEADLAPGGAYAWLSCTEPAPGGRIHVEAYLASLPGPEVRALGERLWRRAWSPDGRYVLYNETPEGEAEAGAGRAWLLPVDGQPQAVAEQYANHAHWHRSEALVALRFHDPRTVLFVNALTGQRHELNLDAPVVDLAWAPAGPGVALVTDDGNLWWLPDAFDATAPPLALAPRLPGLHSTRWSPAGRHLAFVSGHNLFVVSLAP